MPHHRVYIGSFIHEGTLGELMKKWNNNATKIKNKKMKNLKIKTMCLGLAMTIAIPGCSFADNKMAGDSLSTDTISENVSTINESDLFQAFLDGSISAQNERTGSSFYITDLTMDTGELDSYSIGEEIDLDNDGEMELILDGPYGGMYLDKRDDALYVLAEGEGEAIRLSYTYYDDAYWIVKSDTTHGGRKYFNLSRYEGGDNIIDSFSLSVDYDGQNHYDDSSAFKYRDEEITMDEYEKLYGEIFDKEVSVRKDISGALSGDIFDENVSEILELYEASDSEKIYQHTDRFNCLVESYFDESKNLYYNFFAYSFVDNSGYVFCYSVRTLKDGVEMYNDGFSSKIPDLNDFTATDGSDGSQFVEDWYEKKEYDGELIRSYTSGGKSLYTINKCDEEGDEIELVSCEYFYDAEGNLDYFVKYQNPWLWGTPWQTKAYYYDKEGLCTSASYYITHGSVDIYYVYANGQPKYAIVFDNFLGYLDIVKY